MNAPTEGLLPQFVKALSLYEKGAHEKHIELAIGIFVQHLNLNNLLPDLKDMSFFMDIEMARMGMTQGEAA